jgi:hypothetical protein
MYIYISAYVGTSCSVTAAYSQPANIHTVRGTLLYSFETFWNAGGWLYAAFREVWQTTKMFDKTTSTTSLQETNKRISEGRTDNPILPGLAAHPQICSPRARGMLLPRNSTNSKARLVGQHWAHVAFMLKRYLTERTLICKNYLNYPKFPI